MVLRDDVEAAAEQGERRSRRYGLLTAKAPVVIASVLVILCVFKAWSSHEPVLWATPTVGPTPRFLKEDDGKGGKDAHDGDDAASHPTISPAELRQAEQKLREAAAKDEEKVGQAIRQRHFAELFLKDRKFDIDLAVCEAASKFYQFEVLQELIKMGGSVNKRACGNQKGTSIEAAVQWGVDEGLSRIIKELGGDPNIANEEGLPPIYVACNRSLPSHYATIRVLKQSGAKVNGKVKENHLVVHAAEQKQFHITRCLLDNGAGWPWSFKNPRLSLHGKDYLMQLAEVPKYGIDAALCTACRKNITSQILSFMVLGADIEYPWCWTPNLPWYTTPLGHAALHRNEDVVRLLLELGASRRSPSRGCVEAQANCPPGSCFGCFSACEAYASRDDALIPAKAKDDAALSRLLRCPDEMKASAILRKQLPI